jgi:hypothetical protein
LRDILVPCFINTKEATGKSPESRNAGLESLRYVITGNALNFLVVPALNQQGGDDPFDLRGGQDVFEGGREALFI